MGRRTEALTADGSLMEAAAEAARGGAHLPSLFSAPGYRARGCGRAFGHRHLPPQRNPRLAGGLRGGHLRGGGTCVQRRTRRHKESSRRGGRVASVARVCHVGRRCDGGGGRRNGVGRDRWGARGRVHRRNCAGGCADARIGRWGGDAREEVSAWAFFAPASADAARWSRSPNFSA
jgi:hypothetical protein